ncbi:hypothetical protein ACB092_11G086300 [Castanea dentata]
MEMRNLSRECGGRESDRGCGEGLGRGAGAGACAREGLGRARGSQEAGAGEGLERARGGEGLGRAGAREELGCARGSREAGAGRLGLGRARGGEGLREGEREGARGWGVRARAHEGLGRAARRAERGAGKNGRVLPNNRFPVRPAGFSIFKVEPAGQNYLLFLIIFPVLSHNRTGFEAGSRLNRSDRPVRLCTYFPGRINGEVTPEQ